MLGHYLQRPKSAVCLPIYDHFAWLRMIALCGRGVFSCLRLVALPPHVDASWFECFKLTDIVTAMHEK